MRGGAGIGAALDQLGIVFRKARHPPVGKVVRGDDGEEIEMVGIGDSVLHEVCAVPDQLPEPVGVGGCGIRQAQHIGHESGREIQLSVRSPGEKLLGDGLLAPQQLQIHHFFVLGIIGKSHPYHQDGLSSVRPVRCGGGIGSGPRGFGIIRRWGGRKVGAGMSFLAQDNFFQGACLAPVAKRMKPSPRINLNGEFGGWPRLARFSRLGLTDGGFVHGHLAHQGKAVDRKIFFRADGEPVAVGVHGVILVGDNQNSFRVPFRPACHRNIIRGHSIQRGFEQSLNLRRQMRSNRAGHHHSQGLLWIFPHQKHHGGSPFPGRG